MRMNKGTYTFLRTIPFDDEIIIMCFDENSQDIIYHSYKTKKSDSSLINVVSPDNKYKCLELFYKTSGMPISGPNGDIFLTYRNPYDSDDILYYNSNTFEIASSIIEAMPIQDRVAYYGEVVGALKKGIR